MWINSLNMLRTNYDQEKKEYDILKNELVNGKKTQWSRDNGIGSVWDSKEAEWNPDRL